MYCLKIISEGGKLKNTDKTRPGMVSSKLVGWRTHNCFLVCSALGYKIVNALFFARMLRYQLGSRFYDVLVISESPNESHIKFKLSCICKLVYDKQEPKIDESVTCKPSCKC